MTNEIYIEESGITFGPFDTSRCFLIEQSETVKTLKQGIKIVEFTYYSPDDAFYLVEAKSTIPNKNTNAERYREFFASVTEKFENSLTVHAMHTLGRNSHMTSEAPALMQSLYWGNLSIQLRLVIPEIPIQYCQQFTDILRKKLIRLRKLWNIKEFDIKVINEELARKENLVTNQV